MAVSKVKAAFIAAFIFVPCWFAPAAAQEEVGASAGFAAEVMAARARCEADPDAVASSARVTAYDGLRVNCAPPKGAPPCISEAFFHSRSSKGVNYLGQGGGPKDYAVCRAKRTYADWPTAEPHVAPGRAPGDGFTKRPADIAALLGPSRRVLVVGASTARQLHEATLCGLAAAPGPFADQRAQWQFWWRNKYRDASGGCTRRAAARACAARREPASSGACEGYMLADKCFANSTGFQAVLDKYDVVIAAFDPQHYGGSHISNRDWADDMAALFAALGEWQRRHAGARGKAAFVREGSALHFVGGAYRKPPKFQKRPSGGSGGGGGGGGKGKPLGRLSTCECAKAAASWSHSNAAWQAASQVQAVSRRHASVHVLPFYNLTLPRDDMHKGDMCSYRMRRVDGVATAEAPGGGMLAAAERIAALAEERAARAAAAAEASGDDGDELGAPARRRQLAPVRARTGAAPEALAGPSSGRRRLSGGVRPIRACCDCLHMCYSPAFYDQAFFTPIWHALVQHHGYLPK